LSDLGGAAKDVVSGVIDKTKHVLTEDSVISEHAFVTHVNKGLLDKPVKKLMTVTGYLKKFGYLEELPPDADKHDIHSMTKAIKHFQHMYHLKPSGIIDMPTMQAMAKPRCGMPDLIKDTLDTVGLNLSRRGLMREKKYSAPGYVWPKKELTWFFRDFLNSAAISQPAQRAAATRAFQFWQEVSDLKFYEASSPGDINLRFAHYEHGDSPGNSFDGLGGVLAHAYFPTSGEVHFDDLEDWVDRSADGTDITTVAAHEFGHALGLGHSDVDGSLMAPYYQGYDPKFKLHSDDIAAIQSLYGPPGAPDDPIVVTQPPTTTTVRIQPSGAQPDTCTVTFRAVTQTHDYRVYIYSGEWMWRVSEYGLDVDFPMMIASMYEQAPRDIQAALFTSTNSYTHFFKGNVIWRYYGFYLEDQKTITTAGYPTNIQAAIKANSGQIYLIQGSSCWRFNEDTVDVVSPTATPCSTVFPGSPTAFDSAVKLDQQPFIYFFSGLNYYKYSEIDKRVLAGYPKAKAGPWMGPACGAAPFTPR